MPKIDIYEVRAFLVQNEKNANVILTNGDRHFSSAEFSWAEDNTPCGHCDNCLRDPATVVQKDVTSEAKHVLAIARALASRDTKITAFQLVRTARGNGDLAKKLNLSRSDKVTLSPLVRRPFRLFF